MLSLAAVHVTLAVSLTLQVGSVRPGSSAYHASGTTEGSLGEESFKFAAFDLVFGTAQDAVGGIEGLIGMNEDELDGLVQAEGGYHLVAMTREIERNGTETDFANWKYIISGRAQNESDMPEHVKTQIAAGTYHGGSIEPGDYDMGHQGMTLEDFVKDPHSTIASLKPWHVAAARFYTTDSFRGINTPLRQRARPHPWPLTTYYLFEAIKMMRAVRAKEDDFQDELKLWRGMQGVRVDLVKFKEEGGTELAPMSTSNNKSVAEKYAGSGPDSVIFCYKTRALTTGVSLQYLSAYPKEAEYLYPPGTFLAFDGVEGVEGGVKIITVSPQMP